jgi:hypothetical protein
MKFIILAVIISLSLFVAIFIIEEKVMWRLSDTNRFKIWWRNNIVGVYRRDEEE